MLRETVLKAFLKVKISNIRTIIEGHHRRPLGCSGMILLALSHPLVHHMIQMVFEVYLLHHLPRDWGEADWPALPQILLLALLEDVWQETPSCHDFSKIIKSGLVMTSASSFSTHRVHPVRSHGLYVRFVEMFPNLILIPDWFFCKTKIQTKTEAFTSNIVYQIAINWNLVLWMEVDL